MELNDSCIQCLLSRVHLECSLAGVPPDRTQLIAAECRQILDSLKGSGLLHPQIASRSHRYACLRAGDPDPFKSTKRLPDGQGAPEKLP